MKRLIVIGARATGTSVSLVEAAVRQGFRVTIIVDEGVGLDDVFPDGTEIVNLRAEFDTVVSWILQHYGPLGSRLHVTTAHDLYARVAAQVAHALGLPGPDVERVASSVSKVQQKALLDLAGVPTSRFVVCTKDTLAQVDVQLALLRAPLVVKPAEGSASDGVLLCADASRARQHIAELLDTGSDDGSSTATREIVVEEFLQGHEYCVEFFDGCYVGAMRKLKRQDDRFVERGYTSELDLTQPTLKRMIATCTDAVTAAGLTWGPVHLDCIVTQDTPHVVELNPRIAGSFICDIVRDSYGFDSVGALLGKLAGEAVPLPDAFVPLTYARVDFILNSDPPSWEFPVSGNMNAPGLSVRFGPQRVDSRDRRAFLYVRSSLEAQ